MFSNKSSVSREVGLSNFCLGNKVGNASGTYLMHAQLFTPRLLHLDRLERFQTVILILWDSILQVQITQY